MFRYILKKLFPSIVNFEICVHQSKSDYNRSLTHGDVLNFYDGRDERIMRIDLRGSVAEIDIYSEEWRGVKR